MEKLMRSERGMAEWIALMAMMAFGLLVTTIYSGNLSQNSALESEAQLDLHQASDRVTLALASEQECTSAFNSPPLNTMNFNDGDAGTVAMEFPSLSVNGVSVIAVNNPLAGGGKIKRIWLENKIKMIPISNYRHFLTKFHIEADSTSFRIPKTATFNFGVMVNSANKIKYCYLEESVAIKTCQMVSGYFDPQQTPNCRFNFTGVTCPFTKAEGRSCVTGLTATGDLICSKKMEPPPPPPTPDVFCYCGCTPQMLSGSQACGTSGDQYCLNPDGTTYICGSYDLTGCVISSTPPGGC